MKIGTGTFALNVFAGGAPSLQRPWTEVKKKQPLWIEIRKKKSFITRAKDAN